MGTFAAGQVVILPFPFSDLSRKNASGSNLLVDIRSGVAELPANACR